MESRLSLKSIVRIPNTKTHTHTQTPPDSENYSRSRAPSLNTTCDQQSYSAAERAARAHRTGARQHQQPRGQARSTKPVMNAPTVHRELHRWDITAQIAEHRATRSDTARWSDRRALCRPMPGRCGAAAAGTKTNPARRSRSAESAPHHVTHSADVRRPAVTSASELPQLSPEPYHSDHRPCLLGATRFYPAQRGPARSSAVPCPLQGRGRAGGRGTERVFSTALRPADGVPFPLPLRCSDSANVRLRLAQPLTSEW